MNTNYQSLKASQLERKLCLYLGSPRQNPNWTRVYQEWLAHNEIPVDGKDWPSPAAMDDHQIGLFVMTQKRRAS